MRCIIAFVLFTPVLSADWTCVTEPRREACLDGPARRAQGALDELRLLEAAWTARNGPLPDAAPPLRIVFYRNRPEFQPFQTNPANQGLFQSGPDRDWLLVLDSGDNTLHATRHEWVHLALAHTTPKLPIWLEEGLAEYWATLEANGSQARLGKPSVNHIRVLNQSNWLTAAELLAADKSSPLYRDERRAVLFYAQAWAVVHMLGQHPDWKGKLEAFTATLALGADPADAFRQTWGKSPQQAVDEARSWVRMGAPGFDTIALTTPPAPPVRQTRTLDDTAARLLRADALLAHSRVEEAQALIDEALRQGRGRVELTAARGFIALQRGDKPGALKLFDEAIAQGDRSGSVLLERAMLLRETGAPAPQVREALVAAVELNPGLAEGWHLLGNMAAAAGDTAEALRAAEKAVAILPRQSLFWESLGRAYLAAGRPGDATNAAAKAVLSAGTDNERKLADGLSKDAAAWRPPEPLKPAKPWFEVPPGWQGPKPDSELTGRLIEVYCGTNILLFTVETAPKQRTIVRAADPSKIFLRQQEGEKREFVCGLQKPVLLVSAGYKAAPDARTKSAGELILLAIQGAEPPPPPSAAKKPAPAKQAPAKKKSSPPKQ